MLRKTMIALLTLRVRRRLRRLVLRAPVLHLELLSVRVLMSLGVPPLHEEQAPHSLSGAVSTSETRKLSPFMEIGRLWRAKARTQDTLPREWRQHWPLLQVWLC